MENRCENVNGILQGGKKIGMLSIADPEEIKIISSSSSSSSSLAEKIMPAEVCPSKLNSYYETNYRLPEVGDGMIQLMQQPENTLNPYPGCRNIIREGLLKRQVPETSTEIMLASLADSSIKQYDVCMKKWFAFCQENSVDMYNASVSSVIEFLTNIFNSGNQYGSLNSYRAALSLINPEVSRDNRIQRFLKGVYRLQPPLPKYNLT
ncbi:uncharacterized protein LOC141533550 [Cotesia typhae]|uniref:uncharacterized protein LOC141533550 n=1 Tax=Cotesia typhae TaxID=2053667 RepID=UPI003D688B39